MGSTMTKTAGDHVQLFDEQGRLIGTIVRPVTPEVLGPNAEKVYLARRAGRPLGGDRARTAPRTQHAA